MKNVTMWIVSRLKERSTWIGIMAILTGAGIYLAPEYQEAIISVGTAVAGAIAVFTADTKIVVEPVKTDVQTPEQ